MSEPAKETPGLRKRVIRLVLWPVIGGFLMIPRIRRWRRRRAWNWVRVAGVLAGVILVVWSRGAHPLLAGAGLLVIVLAAFLGRLEDPERMQKVADRLGARHVVNGGCSAAGVAALLFLTDSELLFVAAAHPERILTRLPLAAIEAIEVDGEEFRPVYVTFAKAPPQRDERPNTTQPCRLVLRHGASDTELVLVYTGSFARHLAEIAARTIHDCRTEAMRSHLQQLAVIP